MLMAPTSLFYPRPRPLFLKEARSLPHTLDCTLSLVFKALTKMVILCLLV